MAGRTCFSASYQASRSRFRELAGALGLEQESHVLRAKAPDGGPLTIDMAWMGPRDARKRVGVTSATHGVEGFLGAAVQLQLLADPPSLPDDTALFLVHAINPYGFAHIRRVNEDNVDLNRSFLGEGEAYEGAPAGYADFDGMLNPPKPPSRLARAWLPLRAVYHIVRSGLAPMKEVVAGGQYAFPKGVFFGGHSKSNSMEILEERLPDWVGEAAHVLIVDFHTGLGPRATYKLLVDEPAGSPRGRWLADTFGHDVVQAWDSGSVAYDIRGGLGTWVKERFAEIDVDVLAAEFGTVNVLQVINALSMENRAHHWGAEGDASTRMAKSMLMEAFAPSDPVWRDQVVSRGRGIVDRAIAVV